MSEANAGTVILCWGSKVSQRFRDRVVEICRELGAVPDQLMACMAFESNLTFSPRIRNAAGSGAVGLIQFMPDTAHALGTSTEELLMMTAEDQLEWVRKYFLHSKGKLKTLSDLYMAILWPAGVGKPESYVLFDQADPKHPKRYLQNKGLDFNKDGKITKAEASAKVTETMRLGFHYTN